jgi:transglutaminase-like putative cysteine protease
MPRNIPCLLIMMLAWTALADDHPKPQIREFEFTYDARLVEIPEGAESAVMWAPLPVTNALQTINKVNIDTSHPYEIITDATYGNRFVCIELKEEDLQNLKKPPYITLSFDVSRKSMPPMETPFALPNINRNNLDLYLQDSTLVVSGGPVGAEAARIVAQETDPLKQAQRLYNNIVKTVTYDKTGEGWGRGDSLYACDARAGNCTDFHSLFIGQARSLKIPARFIMGFPLPKDTAEGDVTGYHCWAEFFDEARGWLPLDASEAQKNPDMRKAFFGGLDENRIQFTQGRDIVLPLAKQGPINYAIYPYAEVNGEIHSAIETRFHFKNVE